MGADSDDFESADEDNTAEKPEANTPRQHITEADTVVTETTKPNVLEAVTTEILTNKSNEAVEAVDTPITETKPEIPIKTKVMKEKEPDIVPDPVNDPTPEPPADGWGWGGWSSWAASSVSNVAKMASQTTQGLTEAMETLEAQLGLPTPEELAKEIKQVDENEKETNTEEKVETSSGEKETSPPSAAGFYPGSGLWSGLSAMSTAGSQLLTSGMEQLEKVSNQAFEVLNDQTVDSEQKKKVRVKDASKGSSLMSVLQEAKTRYEQNEKISAETMRTMAYLFDERQGLSQLEALEMLSKECVLKMRNSQAETNSLFLYIETSLELKTSDSEIIIEHLGAAVTDCLKTIKIDLPITKLNQCRYEIAQKLTEMDMTSLDETAKPSDISNTAVLDNSLHCIAVFSARSVELFKKIAELSLLKTTLQVDMKTQADTIKFLNEVLCCEIENIREQFELKLKNTEKSKDDINVLYVETSNAVSYVQETLSYFVPILKWIVVKTSATS